MANHRSRFREIDLVVNKPGVDASRVSIFFNKFVRELRMGLNPFLVRSDIEPLVGWKVMVK